jgi:hypothetical protein
MFQINDINLEIESADLFASIEDNELTFGLQICTKGQKNVFMGNEVGFYAYRLLIFNPGEIRRWQDIAGKTVEWTEPSDENDTRAFIQIFDGDDVYHAKFEFEKNDDKTVVKIAALCDFYDGEKHLKEIPLRIETEVYFCGVTCGFDLSEEACIHILKPFMDVDAFRYVQNEHEAIMAVKIAYNNIY